MDRLLFGDDLKLKRTGDAAVSFLLQRPPDMDLFPDASVVELVEALKESLKSSQRSRADVGTAHIREFN